MTSEPPEMDADAPYKAIPYWKHKETVAVQKNEATFPISFEMALDSGIIGPRSVLWAAEECQRWRREWKAMNAEKLAEGRERERKRRAAIRSAWDSQSTASTFASGGFIDSGLLYSSLLWRKAPRYEWPDRPAAPQAVELFPAVVRLYGRVRAVEAGVRTRSADVLVRAAERIDGPIDREDDW